MGRMKKIISIIMVLTIAVSMVFGLELNTAADETAVEATQEAVTETVETQQATQAPTVTTTEGEVEIEPDPDVSAGDCVYDNTKVGKVGKLMKNTKHSDQIQFYWNAVEGADGYRVYYKNNDKDDDYRYLTSTVGTKITVKGLPHTTPFQFKVAAFVIEDDVVYEGDAQVGKTATQPAKVGTPSLKKCSTSIKISWTKNDRADGYRIYRQDSSTKGKLVLYKTIKKNSTTTFEDKSVKKGKAYNYQVRAYRKMYEGKTYIGEGSTLRTVAGLCTPGLVKADSLLRKVSISWKKNAVAQGYDVYYKADDRSSFKLLTSTKGTSVVTGKLRAGHTYYFRVKPYKLVGAKKVKVYGTYLSFNRKATSKAFGKNVGDTYIEISIAKQHMWFYVDGKTYVSTPVVTGNVGAYATPTGAYKIFQKLSPATLTGPTWSSYVQYWMAFTTSGCGIHDASWRSASEFGGTTYMGNGSHGCVNTPTSAVKKIYKKVKTGTYVVVY
ncbi:MAG: L,D-transpeptidase family protein [Eubacteriales bacterium]|nr:L,D-transpeptidase family protein [Eubacteriales bacterium]